MDEYRQKMSTFVVGAIPLIKSAEKSSNTSILIEGAHALILDIDYGTYPYVTSLNAGLGGVMTGLALDWGKIKEVIGVVEAITTKADDGPLSTHRAEE